jgi:pSer/pThr/pTyr-binding forkhead associated (FHA) protein
MRSGAARRARADESAGFAQRYRARLVVVSGPAAGRELELGRPRLLVGRGDEADLVLRDDSLSKAHALFLLTSEGYQLQDLESVNGTWVNGARTEIALLAPDDRIAVGEHVLRYVVEPVE